METDVEEEIITRTIVLILAKKKQRNNGRVCCDTAEQVRFGREDGKEGEDRREVNV
jgi:hypothetical protein